MVSPTPCEEHVSSKDILGCAARRLQPAAVGGADGAGSGENNKREAMCNVVSKIWGSVGLVIENSLLSAARGVRIESVGTFTLDAKGCAGFFLAADFARRFRLVKYDVCSGGCLAGGAVNTRLNVAKVAATAGGPRPEAERVVDAVLRALQQRLAVGSSVTLSFHPVAEFSCTPSGQATMRFLRSFRAKEKAAAVTATRTRAGVTRTKSTPTPLGTAGVTTTAIASGTAGPTTTARSKSTGRRPHSASRGPKHLPSTDRPQTSQLHGDRKSTSVASASTHGNSSTTRDTSLVTSHVGRTTGKGARTRTTLETPPRVGQSNLSRPTTASSCVSSRFSADTPSARRGKNAPSNGIGNTSDHCYHNDDEVRTDTQEETGLNNLALGIVRHNSVSRVASPNSSHRSDTDQGNHEKLLSGLLRRKTLAQAGDEGLCRLIEILRLTHVTGDSGSSNGGGDGGGGRLSGRDLLVALRDIGTKLTSAELAATTSVFRRQPDGRISLPVFLAGIAMGCGETPRQQGAPFIKEEGGVRLSSTEARGKEIGSAPVLSVSAVSRRHYSGLPWESSSCRGGVSAEQALSTTSTSWAGSTKDVQSSLMSSPRLSQSSTVDKLIRRGRLGKEHTPSREGRRGGHQQQPGGERNANGGDPYEQDESSPKKVLTAEQSSVATCSTTDPDHMRRECWGVDTASSRGGRDVARGSTVAGDAIADLARIVYNPPSSLEKLIHVLQASKVNENPTISCAALATRLVRLQHGLGKARAKQLAAAACRYPEKQVDLAQLHAVLERRFGRGGGGGSFSSGGGETSASSATVAMMPSSSSCAAVERVRRKLLTNKRGIGALRVALNSVSGSGGGEAGSLTKDQLRRALTLAGGAGSTPPSTKDVDDLFTLFSSRASGGVGGGRVDTATVLRGLRGELSPFREKVVRDIFRGFSPQRTTSRGNSGDTTSTSTSTCSNTTTTTTNINKNNRGENWKKNGVSRSDGGVSSSGGGGGGGEVGGTTRTPRAQQVDSRLVVTADEEGVSHVGGEERATTNNVHRSGVVGGSGSGGENLGSSSGRNDNNRAVSRIGTNYVGGGRAGLGGWCSSSTEPGLGGGHVAPHQVLLAAAGKVDKQGAVQRRTPEEGVSIEQFLEYYRDVSATIDGDDAFEVMVRPSWPSQRAPPPRSKQDNGGAAATAAAAAAAAEQATGARQVGGGGGRSRSAAVGVALSSHRQKSEGPAANKDGGSSPAGTGQKGSVLSEGSQPQPLPLRWTTAQGKDEAEGDGDGGGKGSSAHPSRGGPNGEESGGTSWSAPEGAAHAAGAAFSSGGGAAAVATFSGNTTLGSPGKKGKEGRGGRNAGTKGGGGGGAAGRQAAATHVQSLFRGHKGRTCAAAEGRKRARRLAAEQEAREEQQRRRDGGRLSRPKGRSTYGF